MSIRLLSRALVGATLRSSLRNTSNVNLLQLFLLTIILGLLGCSNEEQMWNEAKKLASEEAYIDFIIQNPDGHYAEEARKRLEHHFRSLNIKAFELISSNNDKEAKQVLSHLLTLDPKNPIALNNLAYTTLATSNVHELQTQAQKPILHEAIELLLLSLDSANYKRVAGAVVIHVLEGQMIYAVRPIDIDEGRSSHMRDVVSHNLQRLHKHLDIPLEEPPLTESLIVSGTVVDSAEVKVSGLKIWLFEGEIVQEDADSNSFHISTTEHYNMNHEVINPSVITNESGRFSFEIDLNNAHLYVAKQLVILTSTSDVLRSSFTVVGEYILYRDDRPFVFIIDTSKNELELGELKYMK